MLQDFKDFKAGLALYILLSVVACGMLGLTPPQTFNQKLAYAYGSLTSARTATKDLLNSNRITAQEAKVMQRRADNVREFLDAARTAYAAKDSSTAETELKAATGLITALQEILKSKGG